MKYFLKESKRYLFSLNSLLTILLLFAAYALAIFGNWTTIQMQGGLSLILSVLGFSPMASLTVLLPVLSLLPASQGFLEEVEHRFLYASLPRSQKNKYYVTKIASIGFVTSLLVFVSLSLILIANFYLYGMESVDVGIVRGAFSPLYATKPLQYVMVWIFILTADAFAFSCLGFVSSLFTLNPFTALGVVCGIYFIPSFLFPFFGWDHWEPMSMVDLSLNLDSTASIVLSQLALWIVIPILVGMWKTKRMLHENQR